MVLRGPAWSCVVLQVMRARWLRGVLCCTVLYYTCMVVIMLSMYVCMYVEKRKRMEERRDIKILREDLND